MNELFKIRLKALRRENLKTQYEMAEMLDINRSTYGEYERGRIFPSSQMLEKIAKVFNVSVDYLLGSTNFKTHEQRSTAPEDIKDFSQQMKLWLEYLHDKNSILTLDGIVMDDDSREFIAQSLENSLKYAQKLNKKG